MLNTKLFLIWPPQAVDGDFIWGFGAPLHLKISNVYFFIFDFFAERLRGCTAAAASKKFFEILKNWAKRGGAAASLGPNMFSLLLKRFMKANG